MGSIYCVICSIADAFQSGAGYNLVFFLSRVVVLVSAYICRVCNRPHMAIVRHMLIPNRYMLCSKRTATIGFSCTTVEIPTVQSAQ